MYDHGTRKDKPLRWCDHEQGPLDGSSPSPKGVSEKGDPTKQVTYKSPLSHLEGGLFSGSPFSHPASRDGEMAQPQ